MTAAPNCSQPGCAEPSSLVERLRTPLWEHSAAMFCGPQLSQEETLADLNAAADRIEELEKVVREARRFMDPGGDPTRLTHAAMGRRIDEALCIPLERSGGTT